ncbi:hypothetical protein EXU57_04390 [Segetibacter sp. 3557_3]|uniref:hypothetical protein n=1 Tax=Segetibacter sp. 3557_3 TaxID=2547429 RepID=UPI0010591595|nr:hypothetical protein [Segetibacter sp. 3557_3]TDH29308.1 hypothetical protein EXU57_04390 [Segetibacter sp. 3557_3]
MKNQIRKSGFYIPFTLYFLLFLIAGFVAYKWLNSNLREDADAFSDIFRLLLTIALAFAGVLVVLALASVLISFFYFTWNRKKGNVVFKISADHKAGELQHKQTVRLFMKPVIKPLFGFIKLRLQYDQSYFSDKFSLLENSSRKFFNNTLEGTYHWPLPQIKEYHVQKAILYFEDVFQFFSIAVDLPANSHFFTQPSGRKMNDLNVAPRKTEETNTRIEELRKVEGEYLNYKNFEGNDDVRRIVWKIYAKNKELVVRIPEIMDPYASHIYLYATFFTTFNVNGNGAAEVPFLNYFKVFTWTVYQDLVKRGFDVRFIPDHEKQAPNVADEQQAVKYRISTSKWQTNNELRTYCKTSDASVVVIHSMSDPQQVQEILERHGRDISFVFVKLTDSLKSQNPLAWVQWLFVQHEKDDIEKYRIGWNISPLRARVRQNERVIEEIIGKYQNAVVS